jgi:hypothetical protein
MISPPERQCTDFLTGGRDLIESNVKEVTGHLQGHPYPLKSSGRNRLSHGSTSLEHSPEPAPLLNSSFAGFSVLGHDRAEKDLKSIDVEGAMQQIAGSSIS